MRTRKVIALSLLSAGAAFLFSGCPNQPPGPCVVARAFASQIEGTNPGANYVLQYYFLNEAPGSDCTTDPAVAAWPAGNFVGALWAEAYGPVTAIDKVTGLVPEEFGWTNSYTGDYVECSPITDGPSCTDNPIILGNFTTDTEDVNGTCIIQGNDAGTQVVNGVTVTYNFPSTLVLVQSAAGEGTQIQATVQITRQSGMAGVAACVRNYTAIGFWPTAICNVDNDCNPLPQPDNTPPRPIGSGLLPGIPYTCSTTLVPQDPIFAPDNVPSTTPATPCALQGPTGGSGTTTDTCAAFADGDAGVAPGECLNQVVTPITPAVPCTVDASGNDSCAAPGGPGGVCDATTGNCDSVNGTCAYPYLDSPQFQCGDGIPNGPGFPFILLTGGCGGGAKNNNAIANNMSPGPGQTGLCFFANPSPTTFPYLSQ
jgi:hypothetical protein